MNHPVWWTREEKKNVKPHAPAALQTATASAAACLYWAAYMAARYTYQTRIAYDRLLLYRVNDFPVHKSEIKHSRTADRPARHNMGTGDSQRVCIKIWWEHARGNLLQQS